VVITESKKRLFSSKELYGILNRVDEEEFVLDIKAAREERAEEILNNNWMGKIGEVNKE
jgi:hypothetical protein